LEAVHRNAIAQNEPYYFSAGANQMRHSVHLINFLNVFSLLAVFQFLVYPLTVHAGTFRTMSSATERCNLTFEGPITEGDSHQLERNLPSWAERGEFTICLNSPGGLLAEGIQMARIIADRGVATLVQSGDVCTSACAVMFLGGTCQATGDTGVYTNFCRFVDRNAIVGFHAPFIQQLESSQSEVFTSDDVRAIWSRSRLASREYATALDNLGVPTRMIMDFLAVNPNDIAIIRTLGEAREMNVIVTQRFPEATGAEIYIETCASALRSPEMALRDLREGRPELQITSLDNGANRIIILSQLSFLNFPFATWKVCRITYRDYGSGLYPHYIHLTGTITVENCDRVVTEIPDSLEAIPPGFRIADSGRVQTVGPVFWEDECSVVGVFYGANADMWRTNGNTEIVTFR
jgi:hypothetical protein